MQAVIAKGGENAEIVHTKDPRDLQQTPLHIACSLGYIEMADFLIASGGSDIEARDELNFCPLETAAMSGEIL